jgi:hypothetical protein
MTRLLLLFVVLAVELIVGALRRWSKTTELRRRRRQKK